MNKVLPAILLFFSLWAVAALGQDEGETGIVGPAMQPPPEMPAERTFEEVVDLAGYRVDWCKHWARDCGKPAADAFCQLRGFGVARNFIKAENIGSAERPTRTIEDRRLCDSPNCDGFLRVTCARSHVIDIETRGVDFGDGEKGRVPQKSGQIAKNDRLYAHGIPEAVVDRNLLGKAMANCPDPGIVSFEPLPYPGNRDDFDPENHGIVVLRATVSNLGAQDYVTSDNQQMLRLIQGKQVLQTKPFSNLGKGQKEHIQAKVNWDKRTALQDFRVMIVYDRDILHDGNPLNDDCNGANNTRTLSASTISRVFSR